MAGSGSYAEAMRELDEANARYFALTVKSKSERYKLVRFVRLPKPLRLHYVLKPQTVQSCGVCVGAPRRRVCSLDWDASCRGGWVLTVSGPLCPGETQEISCELHHRDRLAKQRSLRAGDVHIQTERMAPAIQAVPRYAAGGVRSERRRGVGSLHERSGPWAGCAVDVRGG